MDRRRGLRWGIVVVLVGVLQLAIPSLFRVGNAVANLDQTETKLINSSFSIESAVHESSAFSNTENKTRIPLAQRDIISSSTFSSIKSTMKPSDLADVLNEAKSIVEEYNETKHVVVQFLVSTEQLELTKNWVCNVRHFGILNKTIFIASGGKVADQLQHFDSSLKVFYLPTDIHEASSTDSNRWFHQYVIFRTNIVLQMLSSKITVWLVDPETTWLRDPTERVSYLQGDIIAMNNKQLPATSICGSFQYLRPHRPTRFVWQRALQWMEQDLNNSKTTIIDGDYYHYFNKVAEKAIERGLTLTFLPQDEFLNGRLYSSSFQEEEAFPQYMVVHNHVLGESIAQKINRTQRTRDWFLTDDSTQCNVTHTVRNVTKGGALSEEQVMKALYQTIEEAKAIAGDSHVIIQLLSAGYLELTRNWICNVRKFGILEKVLFITSDRESTDGLSSFDSSLHVSYLPGFNEGQTSFTFKSVAYKRYMAFRTNMILQMLLSNVTVWLVESDAVWLQDPTERISSIKGDILVLNDVLLPDVAYCGGFQYLRPTLPTQQVWRQTHQEMEQSVHQKSADQITNGSNEQAMLQHYVGANPNIQVTFLPQDEFMTGKLYMEPRDMFPDAKVIHNNWVVGSGGKEKRAKDMSDWFLTQDGLSCQEF